MRKSLRIAAIMPAFLAALLCAGLALADSASCQASSEDFSWYGKSGATRNPVYDAEKEGLWWMPDEVPAGKENMQWGNRGYIFVGAPGKKAAAEKPKAKIVKKAESAGLKDVYFPFDSSNINSANLQVLKENAGVLKSNSRLKVLLTGSASPEGESGYNLKLSERRVSAVKKYLVEKEGISADRLKTQADGEIQVLEKVSWPLLRKVSFIAVK